MQKTHYLQGFHVIWELHMLARISAALLLTATLAACQNTSAVGSVENATADEIDTVETASIEAAADQPAVLDGPETPPADEETKTAALGKDTGDPVKGGVITHYRPPEKGTVFTWRNNWSTLPPVISYVADGTLAKGDKTYVRFKSVKGLDQTTFAYYDTGNFGLKGYRDSRDKALTTFKPVEERYRFPMKAGDKWVMQWKMKDHNSGKISQGGGIVTVIGIERLKLPAGVYQAMKVKLPTPAGLPRQMVHYVWFAPALGVTVKEQIGNGKMTWSQILEKVEPAAKG